jgi:pimeloyl-ACP methyl ester carboxylesterase
VIAGGALATGTAVLGLWAQSAAVVETHSPEVVVRGPFGAGASAVWVLEPTTRPRSVVVFLHGWKVAPPSASDPWVRQFRPWLDHLVMRGNAVLFPAYQRGGDVQSRAQVDAMRRGLEQGFQRLHDPRLPVVVSGYSYGGSLAFSYAALAARWRLPAPAAVQSIFPAGPVQGATLPDLGMSVDVLIEVGDRDIVAGSAGATAFWSWLSRRPGRRQRLVVVRSSAGFQATHAAPKLASPAARRAFWQPLDVLIGRVRSGRTG